MTDAELQEAIERFKGFDLVDPAGPGAVAAIEEILGVVLPADLKKVAEVYSGGILGGISHFAVQASGPAENIVERTLEFRRTVGLPRRYLALAEPPESFIFMVTGDDERSVTPVVWCHAADVRAIVAERPPEASSDRWASYGEFFRYLVETEAEERT